MFAADLHIRNSTPDSHVKYIADMLHCADADMLLLGGDYGESREAALRFFDAVSADKYPLGVFGVPGNNDTEAFGDTGALKSAFPGTMLVNSTAAAGPLVIGGADEVKYGSAPAHDIFDAADGRYRIYLSHYPLFPRFSAHARPQLILSGHTHGGQIRVFGITCYSFGIERSDADGVCGEYEKDGMKLFVSPGVGVSRLPIRAGCTPKIHLIEFA